LIIIQPYYKNGRSDGTLKSHARNTGKTDRFSSLTDGSHPRKNGHQPKEIIEDVRAWRKN
jgi:hypothetical protein